MKTQEQFNLSNDRNSGDYNPFYTGSNNIFPEPLTQEEMDQYGFTSFEYKSDINSGYFAWVYYRDVYRDVCTCGHTHCLSPDNS